ncbi:MAG: hypothetical protein HQK51_01280, partial [Oligoflexia bacterium]|nr:hypothetical protein [Oligoflexia bacterium]
MRNKYLKAVEISLLVLIFSLTPVMMSDSSSLNGISRSVATATPIPVAVVAPDPAATSVVDAAVVTPTATVENKTEEKNIDDKNKVVKTEVASEEEKKEEKKTDDKKTKTTEIKIAMLEKELRMALLEKEISELKNCMNEEDIKKHDKINNLLEPINKMNLSLDLDSRIGNRQINYENERQALEKNMNLMNSITMLNIMNMMNSS